MSLGHRLLLSLGAWTVVYVGGLAIVHEVTLVARFETLEQRLATEHMDELHATFDREIAALMSSSRHRLHLGDLPRLIAEERHDDLQQLLSPEAVALSGLRSLYVFDVDQRLLHGCSATEAASDGPAETELPPYVTATLARAVAEHVPGDCSDCGRPSLVRVDGQLLIIATETLVQADSASAVIGSIVTTRPLDEVALASLQRDLGANVTLTRAVHTTVTPASPSSVVGGSLVSTTTVDDLEGTPVLRMEAHLPRDLHLEGRAARWFGLGTTALGAILLLIALHAEIRRRVVRPVVQLAAEAVQIGATDGRHIPAALERDDELGILSRGLEWMASNLAESRRELMVASHSAGRAEVASSVLHNVGNVLNAISVGSALLRERASTSQAVETLQMIRSLASEHGESFPEWLSNDSRGPHFADLLCEIADSAQLEQATLLEEATSLVERVHHVRAVLARHQGIARASNVAVPFTLQELVEEAQRLARLPVGVGDDVVDVALETGQEAHGPKHRLLEVVVNLLNNATEALTEAGVQEPRISIRGGFLPTRMVWLEVEDNGPGVPEEVRGSLFRMGFTTKETGSGIGLHSSANAAHSLGGSLRLLPGEPGSGAVFRLEFPLNCEDVAARHAA